MRFYDYVIFSNPIETAPGVWGQEQIIRKQYPGEVNRMISKWNRGGDKVNEDKRVNNQVKIIADEFANVNWTHIRSVMMEGVEWAVNTVTKEPPHLILEIGEIYNGT